MARRRIRLPLRAGPRNSMLSAELKSQIQGAYTRFLEAKELKPRYGQRLMIA